MDVPDASIYANPPNPLLQAVQTFGGIAGLQGQLLQNRQLAMQNRLTAGQLALGKVYQGATDASGTIDSGKAASLAAQNPLTAPFTPEAQAKAAAAEQAQQNAIYAKNNAAIEGLKKAMATLETESGYISSAATDPTQKNINDHIVRAYQNGVFGPPGSKRAINAAATFVSQFGDDPEKNRKQLQDLALQASGAQNQLNLIVGQPTYVDKGNGYEIGNQNLRGFHPTGFIPKQLTPEQLAAPYQYTVTEGPNKGQVETVPYGEYLKSKGWNVSSGGQVSPPQTPVQSGTTTAPEPSNAPAHGTPQNMGTAKLSPQEQKALEIQGTASGQQLAQLRSTVGNAQTGLIAQKENLQIALNKLPDVQTGEGSQWVQKFRSTLVGVLPSWVTDKIGSPQKVASYDELNKYLTRAAMALGGTMGAETNDKLAAAITGSPHMTMPRLGIKDVTHVIMSQIDYQVAELKEFQAQEKAGKTSDQDFQQWASSYTTSTDPRIFLMPYMDKAERSALFNSLNSQERTQFMQRIGELKQEGILASQ